MEEIIGQLDKIDLRSAQQIQKIAKNVVRMSSLALEDVNIDVSREMPFETMSSYFSKAEKMIENKKEIISIIGSLFPLLEGLEQSEKKELDNLERDRADLLDAIERKIQDIKECGSERRSSKPPKSPIDDRKLNGQRDRDREVLSKRVSVRETSREDSLDRMERRNADQAQKERGKQIVLEMRQVIEDEIENVVSNKSGSVLFDTQVDGWKMDKFIQKVDGRKKLGFLVFDEILHVFGVFMSETVKSGEWSDDPKLFLFSYTPGQRKPLFYSNIRVSMHDGKSIFKLGDEQSDKFFQVANVIYIQNFPGKKGSAMYSELDDYFFHAVPKSFCGYVYPDMFESKRVVVVQF